MNFSTRLKTISVEELLWMKQVFSLTKSASHWYKNDSTVLIVHSTFTPAELTFVKFTVQL